MEAANQAASRPRPAGRPFRLVDALILTAATAVGLAGARTLFVANASLISSMEGSPPPPFSFDMPSAEAAVYLGLPMLTAWSAALIVIRMMPPRPPMRRIATQPGMTAACAALVAWSYVAVARLIPWSVKDGEPWDKLLSVAEDVPEAVLLGIACSWATLALGRRWRPEASWVDRLGRALAFAWIVLAIPGWLVTSRGWRWPGFY